MSDASQTSHTNTLWNIPNVLTILRIVLSIIIFALIPFHFYKTCFILFIIAALTDFVDGWWARKFNQKTQFGRISDPFADKALVCGTFIYFASIPELHDLFAGSTNAFLSKVPIGLATWMVVAIIMREMFVTMLRSMVEASGGDFSAKWIGKWKTTLQCIDIPIGFLILILQDAGIAVPSWIKWSFVLMLYVVVYLTLYSGWIYIRAALNFNKKQK